MRISLNLVYRSVILTAFLIISQLVFIVVLTNVLQRSQEKIEKQWRSENLIRLTFSICRDFSALLVYIHLPPNLRDLANVEPNSGLSHARRETEILKQLASEDPLKRKAVTKLLSAELYLSQLMESILTRSRTIGNLPFTYASPMHFRGILKKQGKDFYDAVEEIVSIEKNHHAVERTNQVTFAAVSNTLFAAVIASMGIAVVLGFAYAVSIKRPLRHLSDNARLLSAQKKLLPQLAQKDEFGKLDAILHANAREIERMLQKERETIENAADLICTLDEKGLFLNVNPFAQKMLGMPPSAFNGVNVNTLTIAEQSLLADEHVRNAIKSSEVQQFELQLIHANGEVLNTRWSCLWSPVERKLFCVVRDVTEEKKIEQLKQDFADMISHDLRSPLMAMSNALTLLKAGAKGDLPDAARQRIEMSARNVDKLIILVNDLLDFQKLKAGKMELALESVSLQSIINDAADMIGEAAREKNVEIELPTGETIALCDRNKMLQTAVNLISNAIKFSGTDGKVSIKVDENDSNCSFSVSDTGPGIAEEFRQRIFEPFEQAPSGKKNEGTGLGLAICKLVVEAHGGIIRVFNRSDDEGVHKAPTGSVFMIELPKDPSSAGTS